MTEEEYQSTKELVANLKKKIIELNSQILTYENENMSEFFSLRDVKLFIREAQQGALFEFEGYIYEVGDYQYSIEEYGLESTSDFIYSADLKDLLAEGMITKINKLPVA